MSDYQNLTITQTPTGATTPSQNDNLDAQAAAAIEGTATPTLDQKLPQEPEAEQTPEQTQEQEIVEATGVDVEAIEASWLESGTIPETELAKLESVGITKEIVEDYIQYRFGQVEAVRNELITEAGGFDYVSKMQAWAATSWDAAQTEAYNRAVESNDKGQMQLALRALRADYERANGSRAKLVMAANRPNAAASDVYHSFEEMVRDQANPLYKQDPAFRERVAAKLARSNI